jgi:hypothetical protein
MSDKFPLGTAVLTLVAAAYSGCGSQSNTTTGTTESALSASTDGGVATVTACFTIYVDCKRAETSDATSCRKALHDCLRPPPPDGDGGAPRDCNGSTGGDGDASAPPPPEGDPSRPPPPRPGDDDGDDQVPGADGGEPPAGGPRACIDALDTCAASTSSADGCAADAVGCFAALGPPPPRGGHHR